MKKPERLTYIYGLKSIVIDFQIVNLKKSTSSKFASAAARNAVVDY